MHFDQILENISATVDTHDFVISSAWSQGRTTFGGLITALLYTAMLKKLPSDRPLLSLTTSFISPLLSDQTFRIEVNIARQGQTATQMEGRVWQGQTLAVVVLALFGVPRSSKISVPGSTAPQLLPPEACKPLPYLENIIPKFTQQFDMRWAIGEMPFQNSTSLEMGGWMRFREKCTDFTIAHVIALVDVWPPTLLPLMSKPAPASTLVWTLAWASPPKELHNDWLMYKALIQYANHGYGHTCAEIWDAQGNLLALSNQTVGVYD